MNLELLVRATGLFCRTVALSQYDSSRAESDGLPIAESGASKTPKKLPATDAIFDNLHRQSARLNDGSIRRLSLDCKATVKLGAYARGGKTRGKHQASDHARGCTEKYIPCGMVDEDSGALHIHFGSAYKTSDFMVDTVQQWWESLTPAQQQRTQQIQLKMDHGPESSGVRTQFLNRMVAFVDTIGKPIHLLYYPPYHSKYNPVARGWGILEQHWNGTQLKDVATMLAWARSMTWKGLHPLVQLHQQVYQKGISLSKLAMKAVESRLERKPLLPKWDILIRPAA